MFELTLHRFDVTKIDKYKKYFERSEEETVQDVSKEFSKVKDILKLKKPGKPSKRKRK